VRRPWFPFYVDDFLGDEVVKLADNRTIGVYIRLLCHQWREGSLPTGPTLLAQIAHERPQDFSRIWKRLAAKFEKHDNRLVNRRLDDEKEKTLRRSRLSGEASRSRNTGEERFLYAARAVGFSSRYGAEPEVHLIKIGWSRNPTRRLTSLCHADLDLYNVALIGQVAASIELERRAHIDLSRHLQADEWFHDRPEVRQWLAEHGLTDGLTGTKSGPTAGKPPEQSQSQSQSQSQELPTDNRRLLGSRAPQRISPDEVKRAARLA
jgi:uncharacterized protein YdaU (DUF1376 family)